MHKKLLLPHKSCLTCEKDFLWRKKWQAFWNSVLYCSERCRRNKRPTLKVSHNITQD